MSEKLFEFKEGDKVKCAFFGDEVFTLSSCNGVNECAFSILRGWNLYYFTKEGKYNPRHTVPMLNLVERPKKSVKFKDWEDGKRYFSDNGEKYTKKEGLPHSVTSGKFCIESVRWFSERDFYEVEE